ncbi:MAG TPA: OmpA family protein [Bryobacteraceae bacterium]|nr:OmpA family protein [Bryobacteraceae bacterium]
MIQKNLRLAFGTLTLVAIALPRLLHADDTTKVQGLIKARSGALLVVKPEGSPDVNVLLTNATKVEQKEGVFKLRHKEMTMAALIPGLAIEAEGAYNPEKQLVATSVKFKGSDLQRAQAINAGLHETDTRSRENAAGLEKQNAQLQAQNTELQRHQEEMDAQKQKIAANEEQIAANKAAIEAAVARFGQLDDYYILDEATILFANGKANLDSKYKPDLMRLSDKAKTINGFMIEIKGYASSVGSAQLNQKLSQDRATNVASFLLQQGHIPLTNLLAPGAMGESEQVGEDRTAQGQALNRRVVVRILQNKAIAGI